MRRNILHRHGSNPIYFTHPTMHKGKNHFITVGSVFNAFQVANRQKWYTGACPNRAYPSAFQKSETDIVS